MNAFRVLRIDKYRQSNYDPLHWFSRECKLRK